jgi:predicted AlkP superfamily pyrophosphatase or phosphodiesterase
MNASPKGLKKDYYGALFNSPYGNELLLGLAKRAIDAERQGRRETPDLLIMSFSSNDAVGHRWGPDSQEVLDVTLRSDLIVNELLA